MEPQTLLNKDAETGEGLSHQGANDDSSQYSCASRWRRTGRLVHYNYPPLFRSSHLFSHDLYKRDMAKQSINTQVVIPVRQNGGGRMAAIQKKAQHPSECVSGTDHILPYYLVHCVQLGPKNKSYMVHHNHL